MKSFYSLAIAALIFLASGCTTMQDASHGKGEGTSETFNHPYHDVWDAVVEGVKATSLKLVSQNKLEGKILAQKGMTPFSYGENVAVFVTTIDSRSTEVEVVSKKAMYTNILAKNWSNDILRETRKALDPGNSE